MERTTLSLSEFTEKIKTKEQAVEFARFMGKHKSSYLYRVLFTSLLLFHLRVLIPMLKRKEEGKLLMIIFIFYLRC